MLTILDFGAKLSKIDIRDNTIAVTNITTDLPKSFCLSNLPKVKNQGKVGSCVAHATSSILEYFDNKDGISRKLSTNFIYGIQNKLYQRKDKGMFLRDACKIVKSYGDPEESLCKGNSEVPKSWDIAETAFNDSDIMKNAQYFKINSYFKCNGTEAIKKAIYTYGPVLACVKWYKDEKIDSNNNVVFNLNNKSSGYHAVMIYGWNENGFLFQNSWGDSWGNKGRAILPYDIKIKEARGFIDSALDIDSNTDIINNSKQNWFTNIICKIINFVLNFITNLFKK